MGGSNAVMSLWSAVKQEDDSSRADVVNTLGRVGPVGRHGSHLFQAVTLESSLTAAGVSVISRVFD